MLAKQELRSVQAAECDVESVLNYAEYVLSSAPRLRQEFDLDQRQRFQSNLFPQGLIYANKAFGTALTSPVFNLLGAETGEQSQLVGPAGFEPATKGL